MNKESRTSYPEKCEKCEHRKVIHGVRDYNFCEKMNLSFCGAEPESFFDCDKYGAKKNDQTMF